MSEDENINPAEFFELLQNRGSAAEMVSQLTEHYSALSPDKDGYVSLVGSKENWAMGRKVRTEVQTGFARGFWPKKNVVSFGHDRNDEPLDPEVEIKWQMFADQED